MLILLFISIILLSIGLFLFYYYNRDENNEKGEGDDNEDGDDNEEGEGDDNEEGEGDDNEEGEGDDNEDGDDNEGDDVIYENQFFGDLERSGQKNCNRNVNYNINSTNECKTLCLNRSDCVGWEYIEFKDEPTVCFIITNSENGTCTQYILDNNRKCIIPSTLNNCRTDYNNYYGSYQYAACGMGNNK